MKRRINGFSSNNRLWIVSVSITGMGFRMRIVNNARSVRENSRIERGEDDEGKFSQGKGSSFIAQVL